MEGNFPMQIKATKIKIKKKKEKKYIVFAVLE